MPFGFGKGIDLLLDGEMLRRADWSGDKYISNCDCDEGTCVPFHPRTLVTAGSVRLPWHANSADLFAQDWERVEMVKIALEGADRIVLTNMTNGQRFEMTHDEWLRVRLQVPKHADPDLITL